MTIDIDREEVEIAISGFDSTGVLETMYREAVVLLNGYENRSQLTLLAHATRELVNELCRQLADSEGTSFLPRSNVDSAVKALVVAWADSGLRHSPVESTALQAVPAKVFQELSNVVALSELGTHTHREKLSLILGPVLDSNKFGTREIKSALDTFEPYYHLGRKSVTMPPRDDIDRSFQQLEIAIVTRLRPFFDTLETIDELLQKVNSRKLEEEQI